MNTRKIILYEKYFELSEDLTNEQFGKVLRAIGSFFIDGDEGAVESFSKDEKILYKMMKQEIKVNFDKYDKICEKRRKAAKIGVEKRKQIEQMLTNAGNNKNNNKNKNSNKNNNININNKSNYDFDEIERLVAERRMKAQKQNEITP